MLAEAGRKLFGQIIPNLYLGPRLRREPAGSYLIFELSADLVWIPWELLHEGEAEHDRPSSTGNFLCQKFRVARKLRRSGGELVLVENQMHRDWTQKVLVILGNTKGLDADEELKLVSSELNSAGYSVLTPHLETPVDVLDEITKCYDVVHFIGHGRYQQDDPENTGLECRDKTLLNCQTIRDFSGPPALPTLVFANACESAPPSLSVSENYVGDLCLAFQRQGVPHYIGTLVRVSESATSFAQAFYQELAKGFTIAEAVHESRRKLDEEGSLIWAYYVYYGDPMVRIANEVNVASLHRPVAIPTDYRASETIGRMEQVLMPYHTKPFIGRDHERNLLDKFIAERSNGIMEVTGKAGFGKTALLCNWLMARKREGYFVAYHFFSHLDSNLPHLVAAYRSLLYQLFVYYEIADPLPEDEERLSARLFGLLQTRGSHGPKPLIIVIDGLDEAEHPFSSPFPVKLRDGVFIIVSARADVHEQQEYLRGWMTWTRNAEQLHLRALSRHAITEWMRLCEDQRLAGLADKEDFVAHLHEVTEGFPLYLQYLLEELVETAKTSADLSGALAAVPHGFRDYIRLQWKLLTGAEDVWRSRKLRRLFALMTVGLGPVPRDDLTALTGLTIWDLPQLPWQITRWLSIRSDENHEYTYCFAHRLLATEFKTLLDQKTVKATADSLLERCASWSEHKSSYPFVHYSEHLWKEKRFETLFALAKDHQFRQGQLAALNDLNHPLRTLRFALHAAAEINNASKMAEFSVEHALSLAAFANENPVKLLQANKADRAFRIADLCEPTERLLWYLVLAWELKDRNEHDAAEIALSRLPLKSVPLVSGVASEEIFKSLSFFLMTEKGLRETIIPLLDDQARRDLGICLARLGDITTPLTLANTIRRPAYRAKVLGEVAVAQEREGKRGDSQSTLDGAFAAIQEMESDLERREVVLYIVAIQAEARQFSAAIETYRMFCSLGEELFLDLIMRAQVAAGQLIDALKTAKLASDDVVRATISAKAFGRAGRHPEGLALAAGIQENLYRACALISETARAGKTDLALKMAVQLPDSVRWLGLQHIAHAQIDSGWLQEALDTVTKLEGRLRDFLQMAIAVEYAKLTQFVDALNIAKQIQDSRTQIRALGEIAAYQARAGRFSEARTTVGDIIQIARMLDLDLGYALEDAAIALADVGQVSTARTILSTASRIQKSEGRIQTFFTHVCVGGIKAIMAALVKAGQFHDAVSFVHEIDDEGKAYALTAMAVAQAKIGRTEEALSTFAGALESAKALEGFYKSTALVSVALAQAEVGRVCDALETIQGITSKGFKDKALMSANRDITSKGFQENALMSVAKMLADAGEIQTCLEVVKNLEDSPLQTSVLAKLAMAQFRNKQVEEAIASLARATVVWQQIEGVEDRVRALTTIGAAQAELGQIKEARQTFALANSLVRDMDAEDRSTVLNDLAIEQVGAGFSVDLLDLLNSIRAGRIVYINAIVSALGRHKEIDNLKKLLIPSAYHLDAVCSMCGALLRAYPEQATDVATVLNDLANVLEKPQNRSALA